MGRGTLGVVRDRLGNPHGGPGRVKGPSGRSGTGRGLLGRSGWVGGPSWMSGTGWGTVEEVQNGSGTLG